MLDGTAMPSNNCTVFHRKMALIFIGILHSGHLLHSCRLCQIFLLPLAKCVQFCILMRNYYIAVKLRSDLNSQPHLLELAFSVWLSHSFSRCVCVCVCVVIAAYEKWLNCMHISFIRDYSGFASSSDHDFSIFALHCNALFINATRDALLILYEL